MGGSDGVRARGLGQPHDVLQLQVVLQFGCFLPATALLSSPAGSGPPRALLAAAGRLVRHHVARTRACRNEIDDFLVGSCHRHVVCPRRKIKV